MREYDLCALTIASILLITTDLYLKTEWLYYIGITLVWIEAITNTFFVISDTGNDKESVEEFIYDRFIYNFFDGIMYLMLFLALFFTESYISIYLYFGSMVAFYFYLNKYSLINKG